MRRGVVLGLLAALCCLALPAARGEAVMYWGGTIKGSVYGLPGEAPKSPAVLERFEADAGKPITFVNTGQGWADFDRPTMDAAIAAGAIPLVTMGLAEGVTLADVVGGEQDEAIRAWAREAREFGYPFLFRPWWEVNGEWYSWGRDPEFIAAWHHFHDLVVAAGATNVTWAWIVNTIWYDPGSDPTPYYPGDAYVDWVGMDAYNWGQSPIQPDRWESPAEAIGPTLEVLEDVAPGKPVCICEDASTEYGGDKAAWITKLLDEYLPSQPSIKAYLWFNWNIEQDDQEWDWPIESSPAAEAAFRAGIQSDEYLASLPPLTKLAKVPMPVLPVDPGPEPGPDTPAANPPAPAPPHAPGPARVGLGRHHFDRGVGTGAVEISLPGPGTLALRSRRALAWVPRLGGRPARRATRPVPDAGRFLVRLAPTGATRRRLARTGRAKVLVALDFTAASGAVSHRATTLTLRASPPG